MTRLIIREHYVKITYYYIITCSFVPLCEDASWNSINKVRGNQSHSVCVCVCVCKHSQLKSSKHNHLCLSLRPGVVMALLSKKEKKFGAGWSEFLGNYGWTSRNSHSKRRGNID